MFASRLQALREFDLSSLRIPQSFPGGISPIGTAALSPQKKTRGRPHSGYFLRGPIPLVWLNRALAIGSSRTMAVALAIWFLAGMNGRQDNLKLTSATLMKLGVTSRSAKSRGLDALEGAGLIKVTRERGKNPLITILTTGDGT